MAITYKKLTDLPSATPGSNTTTNGTSGMMYSVYAKDCQHLSDFQAISTTDQWDSVGVQTLFY